MADTIDIQKSEDLTEAQVFKSIEKAADFQIVPIDGAFDLDDPIRFTKLQLGAGQKMHMSALLQQTPQALAAGTLSKAYTVSFPEGLPHTLTALKQGGFGSMIQSEGRFVGSASFYSAATQAAALGAFTVMSAVSGQYFLAQINSELNIVNKKLDDILEFLYGEKKAELLAEISFVKYAHSNFRTIMMHDDQRAATIGSLQAAKKIAMKDIEFYLNDLSMTSKNKPKDYQELCTLLEKAMKIKGSLEMSRQLYVVSGLLELYYAQNYETEYITFVENDMISYINTCDRHILGDLGVIQGKLNAYKPKPLEKTENKDQLLETISAELEPYKDGNDSPIRMAMHEALESLHRRADYYINASGEMYVRRTA